MTVPIAIIADEAAHRRLTRYSKTLSSESSVGATSKSAHAGVAGDPGDDPGEPGELRDPDGEPIVAELGAEHRRLGQEGRGEPPVVGRADAERVRPVGHQPADLAVVAGRREPPGVDDEDAVGEALDLLEDVRAEEDRPARPRPSSGAGPSCAAAGAGPCR